MIDATPAVRLADVSKRFDGASTDAVRRLSLDVPRGSVVALIGPSGCGKTTTLRMINRLVEPSSGHVEVDGRDTRVLDPIALRLGIGYVIQAVGLFPHRTVADNIAIVPRALGWDRPRIRARVAELADLVGLDDEQLARFPDELSGGQQQRVGVARALAADPPILLMDEPFGAVDPVVRARLQQELLDLQARLRKTIVLVTHDLDEALGVADLVALLDIGGRLAQYDTPDELLRSPSEPFVTEFLGADRSLRRLRLRRVGSLILGTGPVVAAGTDGAEARRVLAQEGGEWLGVTDGERFLGWTAAAGIADDRSVAELPLAPPAAVVTPDDTLRAAMDRIMTARTAVAVVIEDGRYRGVVTLETIRRALVEAPGRVEGDA
jgi:osmoprotectant transport system ATP-binding protein